MTKKPTRLQVAEAKVEEFWKELSTTKSHVAALERKASEKDVMFAREMQSLRETFQLTDQWRQRAMAAEFRVAELENGMGLRTTIPRFKNERHPLEPKFVWNSKAKE